MTAGSAGVLDTNGIIGLAKGECLTLVRHLFRVVYVPPLVVQEVKELFVQAALQQALADWLKEETPTPTARQQVEAVVRTEADRQVIALAIDHQPAYLLTGDVALQKKARQFGILSIDAPHLVQLMVEAKLLEKAKPCLDLMQQRNFGIHEPIYRSILLALGEQP